MEHRHTERKFKKLRVRVHFDDGYTVEASTLDVSRCGLFLKLCDQKLVSNMTLQLVLRESGSATTWRSRAMVIHVANCGAGILLEKHLPSSVYPTTNHKEYKLAKYQHAGFDISGSVFAG